MKKMILLVSFSVCLIQAMAQTTSQRISKAFETFLSDSQLTAATVGFYVVEKGSGDVVFDHNGQVGLAPASTQKIITAASAYELLGKDFRYATNLYAVGKIQSGTLVGNLAINGDGDPTLGSFRWWSTSEVNTLARWSAAIRAAGIRRIAGPLVVMENWKGEVIPDGWIWQDIGNYYGAGAAQLNWRENQFDVIMRSGASPGDPVLITGYKPDYPFALRAGLLTAAKGTGDQAYVYYPPLEGTGIVRGTIPAGENAFTISAAMMQQGKVLDAQLGTALRRAGIATGNSGPAKLSSAPMQLLYTETSPSLDSIVYWFLKKSVNLYGEALVRKFSDKAGTGATTENGVDAVRDLWASRGIPKTSLAMVDGSGLSPLNRVTAKAQVDVLRYAAGQSWFPGFFNAFPEYNGMKMKSGTIQGAKAFCGYHTAADGKSYIFSLIVNNYNGSASQLVRSMYTVLNTLK